MLLIRRFEEKCAELYHAGMIRGFLHLSIGEEAVAAGVMSSLYPDDAVVSNHREHGHALARGIDPARIMAEMFGAVTGCSRGRGGSMHLFDAATRFYGGNAIVGSCLPVAAGLALADRMRGTERVTAVFFGEGAAAEGEFHETMNLAALWKLPLLFCCENNRYAMGTEIDLSLAQPDLVARASSYGVQSNRVDGMDAVAVARAAAEAASGVRAGSGPRFLEFETYRFRAHSMYDPELYRPKAEVERWKARDPIVALRRALEVDGAIGEGWFEDLADAVGGLVESAVAEAMAAPLERVEDLPRFVYAEDLP